MKYFVLFKRQKDQEKHAYSIVTEDILETIPLGIIEKTKEIPDKEIYTKEECRIWVEELGGIWYANN